MNGVFDSEKIRGPADTRWKALYLTFPTHLHSRAVDFIKWVMCWGEWWWGVDIWDISFGHFNPPPPVGGRGGRCGGVVVDGESQLDPIWTPKGRGTWGGGARGSLGWLRDYLSQKT